MPGSSMSISSVNIVLNTTVADVVSDFSDRLEKCSDFEREVDSILQETFSRHRRIIFSGDNYSEKWVAEAKKRGLLNLKTTVDVLPYLTTDKNIKLFSKHKVFSEKELYARKEIAYENYSKTVNIEARTMIDMSCKDIVPVALKYVSSLESAIAVKKNIGLFDENDAMYKVCIEATRLYNELYINTQKLKSDIEKAAAITDSVELANYFSKTIIADMNDVRDKADKLELVIPASEWPYPVYSDLMFRI